MAEITNQELAEYFLTNPDLQKVIVPAAVVKRLVEQYLTQNEVGGFKHWENSLWFYCDGGDPAGLSIAVVRPPEVTA